MLAAPPNVSGSTVDTTDRAVPVRTVVAVDDIWGAADERSGGGGGRTTSGGGGGGCTTSGGGGGRTTTGGGGGGRTTSGGGGGGGGSICSSGASDGCIVGGGIRSLVPTDDVVNVIWGAVDVVTTSERVLLCAFIDIVVTALLSGIPVDGTDALMGAKLLGALMGATLLGGTLPSDGAALGTTVGCTVGGYTMYANDSVILYCRPNIDTDGICAAVSASNSVSNCTITAKGSHCADAVRYAVERVTTSSTAARSAMSWFGSTGSLQASAKLYRAK